MKSITLTNVVTGVPNEVFVKHIVRLCNYTYKELIKSGFFRDTYKEYPNCTLVVLSASNSLAVRETVEEIKNKIKGE